MTEEAEETAVRSKTSYRLVLLSAIIAVAGMIVFYAATSRLPVRIIAAEAGNQGLRTMMGVGEVIRNRGSFKGFSVLQKDVESVWKNELPSVRHKAELAWMLSALTHFTRGATHFENVRAFGLPPWASEMRATAVLDGFVFFKSARETYK